MIQYNLLFLSIVLLCFDLSAQDQKAIKKYNQLMRNSCITDLDAQRLAAKYEKSLEIMDQYFIEYSVDDMAVLTNDGIGKWDTTKCAYEYAGKNLPIYSYDLTTQSYHTKRHFGETPVRLGQLLATTCLQYTRAKSENDIDKSKILLNKIFLQLQAYRRLDMTANKLMECYYSQCGNDQCPDFEVDDSGYTGFIVRDDVPFNFPTKQESDTPLHFSSKHADSDMTRLLRSMIDEGLVSKDPTYCEMACYFPRDEQRQNGGNQNTITQDQHIGILQGLMYVKKFVAEDEYVMVGKERYNVLEIAQKIALGINKIMKACSNNMKFPGCVDCDDAVEAKNGGVAIYYYGIAYMVEYITGKKPSTNAVEKIGWSLSASVESILGMGQQHNIRMYNKVSSFANLSVVSETLEDALQAGNLVTPLELIIFHDNYKVFKGDRNPFDGNAPKKWRDRYCELLTTYPDDILVNSTKNEIKRKFKLEDNTNDLWCNGSPLESNLDYCNRNSVFSPLEYLYMYSVMDYLGVFDSSELE